MNALRDDFMNKGDSYKLFESKYGVFNTPQEAWNIYLSKLKN
jgi:hypothetical protein